MALIIFWHAWIWSVVAGGSTEKKQVSDVKFILENFLYFTKWQNELGISDFENELNEEYYRYNNYTV